MRPNIKFHFSLLLLYGIAFIPCVCIVTPLQAAGPTPGEQLNILGMEKYVYKTVADTDPQYTNQYVFVSKPPGWQASDSRNALVFIHGGAFSFGDPSGGVEYCRYFASRGMVTFSLEYRVSQMQTAKKPEEWNPQGWKSMSDCVEAIRWIRAHAGMFGIATNRIIAGGYSAGAISTAGLLSWKHVPPEYPCGDVKISPVPDAVYFLDGWSLWSTKGDPTPPLLFLRPERGMFMSRPDDAFKTQYASQPYKEWRLYRNDIAPDGRTNYVADHVCMASQRRYFWPALIDLDEWLVSLGYLTNHPAQPLTDAPGFCQIDAVDFSDRYPRILQNAPDAPVWRINIAKDTSAGYLMDCAPPSVAMISDADILKAPRLEYRIDLKSPGKYYAWANIRASWETEHHDKNGLPDAPYFFRSKQLRLGVNDGKSDRLLSGNLTTTPDGKPSWQRIAVTDPIVVSAPGVITLKAYAVSAGIRLEQLILTTDSAYTPPSSPYLNGAKEVTLKGAEVTDVSLTEQIKASKGLQVLSLQGTSVTESGLKNLLKGQTGLQELAFGGKQATDAFLEGITDLTGLQVLSLWNASVTDAGLAHLKGFWRLRELVLNGTQVTDAGLENLKGLSKLQILRLKKTQVTPAGVEQLQKSLPACYIEF